MNRHEEESTHTVTHMHARTHAHTGIFNRERNFPVLVPIAPTGSTAQPCMGVRRRTQGPLQPLDFAHIYLIYFLSQLT